jgi:hypothetical protein
MNADKLQAAINFRKELEEEMIAIRAAGEDKKSNKRFREVSVDLHLVNQWIEKINRQNIPFQPRKDHAELLVKLEALCKSHDWYFEAANGEQYYRGRAERDKINSLVNCTGDDGKAIYDKYYKSITV